ncbi:FAD-dependent oxidoreductase [Flavihumibacter sp. CACIAM 22H1]|uniref:NAD(P)/FAD-dependent oxidoreductase n=1 Tax=Flavihumibacter sp. CACIAM 22H1 TaxID=1812911 RepID=UPI0007A91E9D|nr:FAD-dependent oxidoreductase [Flavihumibacter sp. CACIAM 22H1]KYP16589.1 MAG: hypothetical protein A1D16_09225 [Flavihumibacter sp. CACIAM 22H1]
MEQKIDLLIIGGGIWGCAIAYYYSTANPGQNVLVLEQNELNNGATSRAAALLTKVRSNQALIPLAKETARIIPVLETALDDSLDIKKVGLAQVATDAASLNALESMYKIADRFDEPYQKWTSDQLLEKTPWLKLDAALEIGYFPEEAYCDPYRLGSFFARTARKNGVAFRQSTRVTELVVKNGRVTAVLTGDDRIRAEQVVLAAGVWSNQLLEQFGAAIPYAPVRSQFWITEPVRGLQQDAPIVLIPSANAYLRPEGNCLLFGIREQQSIAVAPGKLPMQMNDFLYSADKGFSELADVIHLLEPFYPEIYNVGIKSYMAGFSGYSPDACITAGACSGLDNLFVAGGDCGAGIALSGGLGQLMTALLSGSVAGEEIAVFRPDRFGSLDAGAESWLQQCAAARSKKKSG